MAYVIPDARPWFNAKLAKAVIEAGEDGLDGGTLQEVLQSLASRIQALENAQGDN